MLLFFRCRSISLLRWAHRGGLRWIVTASLLPSSIPSLETTWILRSLSNCSLLSFRLLFLVFNFHMLLMMMMSILCFVTLLKPLCLFIADHKNTARVRILRWIRWNHWWSTQNIILWEVVKLLLLDSALLISVSQIRPTWILRMLMLMLLFASAFKVDMLIGFVWVSLTDCGS